MDTVRQLAGCLSNNVQEISSEKRKKLHLAGVIANNFTNHLYMMAGKILEEEGLDFNLLKPLIFETAHKVMLLPPYEAQTGPARRGDENILGLHKSLLKKTGNWLYFIILCPIRFRKLMLKRKKKKRSGINRKCYRYGRNETGESLINQLFEYGFFKDELKKYGHSFLMSTCIVPAGGKFITGGGIDTDFLC